MAQLKAGIAKPIGVHGIRLSAHDAARKAGINDTVVRVMAGHSDADSQMHDLYSMVAADEMKKFGEAIFGLVHAARAKAKRPGGCGDPSADQESGTSESGGKSDEASGA